MKNVSIVIPNWNGRELLERFFASAVEAAELYRSQTNADVEIVIVDDGSTDDSLNWLSDNYGGHKYVKVVKLDDNVGFLRAVNLGFEEAAYPVVFLLNSDVLLESDCIGPLVTHFELPNVFAVCCHARRIGTDRLDGGGKIGKFERGFWRVFVNYDALPDTDCELISFFGSGGYTAYDREKWDELGGFQDCLSPNYWEDVEISYRAWKRGWKVLYEPRSIVNHLGSVSMKKSNALSELDIVSERNRLLMTWINLHDKSMLASHFIWIFLKLISSIVSLRWNFVRSLTLALRMLDSVRQAKRIEMNEATVSDNALNNKFRQFLKKNDIHILDSYNAELSFAEHKKNIAEQDANIG